MKIFAASALAVGLSLFGMSASHAMPVAPIAPAASAAASGELIQVAQGCGPGLHRGPHGVCRPMFGCPRGWRPGPYGRRCVRRW